MRFLIFLFLLILVVDLQAQRDFYDDYPFTRADTLRGSLRPERTCYDVYFYWLNITLDPQDESIKGYVDIEYTPLVNFTSLQLDLFAGMTIDKIYYNPVVGEGEYPVESVSVPFRREHDAVFVDFDMEQREGRAGSIRVYYHGEPTKAVNAPWDGGFVYAEDQKGRPWMAVACEGEGASLWWPNKDHLSDEPDSMLISLTVPERYMAVANGNLRGVKENEKDKTARYDWFVSYPIDNYNVTFNIGHYTHFHDTYEAADEDTLALDYYVIDYNEERARKHFQQVHSVLSCYEKYLGKYPFWEDGFALVETPYLGMEHQSAIAYGNRYMRGYLGGLIPRDMGWDYIIVHETGHEYFGNSIGCADMAEMWIQESFTTYLEALYVEYTMSYEDANRYLAKQKLYISNHEPIVGPKDVNWYKWDSSDHYYKGAWVLHTLRHAIGDDKQWFAILKGFYQKYALSLVSTEDFVQYVNEQTGKDWQAFFEQYLYHPTVPVLRYRIEEKGSNIEVYYRWAADLTDFAMPVNIVNKEKLVTVTPNTKQWQKMLLFNTKAKDFQVAESQFLIKLQEE